MAVSGTFTTTGQSSSIKITHGMLILQFGTGTVVLQVQDSAGGWVNVPDASYTADTCQVIDGAGATYRLDCTAQSGNILYDLFEANTPQS